MPLFEEDDFKEESPVCSRCGNPADKKILTKVPLCRKCALEVAAERQAQKTAAKQVPKAPEKQARKAPERQVPKAPADPKEWKVILEDGTPFGPYDLPTLKRLIQEKKISGFAKVSQSGGGWQKAYTVPQLAVLFKAAPPKEVEPPQPPEEKVEELIKLSEEDGIEELGFKVEPPEERGEGLIEFPEEEDLPE